MTAQASKFVRGSVEGALRSPGIPTLADNEIGRLLGASGHFVGWCRRRLEARGEIEAVDRRLDRRGCLVDVRRIGKWEGRKFDGKRRGARL
jgi:hypothetical protein